MSADTMCQSPKKCAEAASWIHNPHKDWAFVSNNSYPLAMARVEPTGYAFPFSQRPVFELTDASITPKKPAPTPARSILQRIAKWCKREPAQSELAALRKELDTAKKGYAIALNKAVELSWKLDQAERLYSLSMSTTTDVDDDLKKHQKYLADAWRRNAELVELLRDIKRYGTNSVSTSGPHICQRIDAAINHTESGEGK